MLIPPKLPTRAELLKTVKLRTFDMMVTPFAGKTDYLVVVQAIGRADAFMVAAQEYDRIVDPETKERGDQNNVYQVTIMADGDNRMNYDEWCGGHPLAEEDPRWDVEGEIVRAYHVGIEFTRGGGTGLYVAASSRAEALAIAAYESGEPANVVSVALTMASKNSFHRDQPGDNEGYWDLNRDVKYGGAREFDAPS